MNLRPRDSRSCSPYCIREQEGDCTPPSPVGRLTWCRSGRHRRELGVQSRWELTEDVLEGFGNSHHFRGEFTIPAYPSLAERGGVEPPRPRITVLDRFRGGCRCHIGLPFHEVPGEGLEPPTRSSSGFRSTIELPGQSNSDKGWKDDFYLPQAGTLADPVQESNLRRLISSQCSPSEHSESGRSGGNRTPQGRIWSPTCAQHPT